MDHGFDARRHHVYVAARLKGPVKETVLQLAVDTGAVRTMIRPRFLRFVGYDLDRPESRGRLYSATGGQSAPVIRVERLTCLGQEEIGLRVICHDPPIRFEGDGLLGLDFLGRTGHLRIDFVRATISLDPPRKWWRPWG